jgi:hypothetical protein
MSSLIQTCAQLRIGLQKAKVANQTRQEISAIQQRMREWGQCANTRRVLTEKVRIVDPLLLVREDIVQADCNVKGLAQQAKELLLAGGNVQDLATDNLWTRLTAAAESANQDVRSAACDHWRKFVQNFGPIESPTVLDARIVKTPANVGLFESYKQHYTKYSAIVRAELPANSSTPEELISAVSTLQALREQLIGTVPEVVRAFFKALENGGAELGLITPEVLEWLRENDDPNRFVVKSRASVSWR